MTLRLRVMVRPQLLGGRRNKDLLADCVTLAYVTQVAFTHSTLMNTALGTPFGSLHGPRMLTCLPPEARRPVGREAPQHAHVAHHAAVAGPQQQALDQAPLRGAQPGHAVHCRQGRQLRMHAHRDWCVAQQLHAMGQTGLRTWQHP